MPKISHKHFYLGAYKIYGKNNPKSLHWNSKESQEQRFLLLCEALGDITNKTVVDAGCGFGDFYLFLKKHHSLPKRYIGVEQLEEFVHIAKKNTKQTIIHGDVLRPPLPKADIYIASGTLNTLTRFESILFLRRLFELSNERVIFNFLCGNKESQIYNYIPKQLIYNLIKQNDLSIYYEKEGYLKSDMTLGLHS